MIYNKQGRPQHSGSQSVTELIKLRSIAINLNWGLYLYEVACWDMTRFVALQVQYLNISLIINRIIPNMWHTWWNHYSYPYPMLWFTLGKLVVIRFKAVTFYLDVFLPHLYANMSLLMMIIYSHSHSDL